MNYALLTAGGSGTRMNLDVPKQFICVHDKPIIIYTMESFQKHPDIDGIIVVCLEGWLGILEAYAKQYQITKLKWIVPGGSSGQESIRAGLLELKKHISPEDIILVHDGNRPLVSQDVISDAIVCCKRHGSAVAGIPCHEAVFIKETAEDGETVSDSVLERSLLIRTQTPHAFQLKKLLWAHEEAEKRGIQGSVASCTLLAALGERLHFSIGSKLNFKITTKEDLQIFRALIDAQK